MVTSTLFLLSVTPKIVSAGVVSAVEPVTTKNGGGDTVDAYIQNIQNSITEHNMVLEEKRMVALEAARVERVRNPMEKDGWYITAPYHSVDDMHYTPHQGLDFGNGPSVGWGVFPVAAGEVVFAGTGGLYGACGHYVIIWHHNVNKTSMYCHMVNLGVTVGDIVTPDTRVGEVGSTGRSTGIHLHLTIFEGNNWASFNNTIDPYDWLENNDALYKY